MLKECVCEDCYQRMIQPVPIDLWIASFLLYHSRAGSWVSTRRSRPCCVEGCCAGALCASCSADTRMHRLKDFLGESHVDLFVPMITRILAFERVSVAIRAQERFAEFFP